MKTDEIRIIRPDEWAELRPVFEQENGTFPDPEHATAAVVRDGRGLAGFWCLQQMSHGGPLWIREDRRKTRLWEPLQDEMAKLFEGTPKGSGFYSFSDGPRMDHVFSELGYTDLNYKVWKKEF